MGAILTARRADREAAAMVALARTTRAVPIVAGCRELRPYSIDEASRVTTNAAGSPRGDARQEQQLVGMRARTP